MRLRRFQQGKKTETSYKQSREGRFVSVFTPIAAAAVLSPPTLSPPCGEETKTHLLCRNSNTNSKKKAERERRSKNNSKKKQKGQAQRHWHDARSVRCRRELLKIKGKKRKTRRAL
jgi:hypothetical protein